MGKLLYECGLFLGPQEALIAASPDNPDGHWEHKAFVQLNDEVLNALGGGWDCPSTPTMGTWCPTGCPSPVVWHTARIDVLRIKAEKLADEFCGREPWGWKDPRNCLTWPFWASLFPDLRAVICLRNPLDVAISLRQRGLSSYSFGIHLWKTYNEELLRRYPGEPAGDALRSFSGTSPRRAAADPAFRRDRLRGIAIGGVPVERQDLFAAPSLCRGRHGCSERFFRYHFSLLPVVRRGRLPLEGTESDEVRRARAAKSPDGNAPSRSGDHDHEYMVPEMVSGATEASDADRECAVPGAGDADLPDTTFNPLVIDVETLRRSSEELRRALEQRDDIIRNLHARVESSAAEREALARETAANRQKAAELQTQVERLERQCKELSSGLMARSESEGGLLELCRKIADSLEDLRGSAASREELTRVAAASRAEVAEMAAENRERAGEILAASRGQLDDFAAAFREQLAQAVAAVSGQAEQLAGLAAAIEEMGQGLAERHQEVRGALRNLRRDARARQEDLERAMRAMYEPLWARQADLQKAVCRMHEESLVHQDDLFAVAYELTASQALARLQGEPASERIAYEQLLQQIRDEIRDCLPRDAVVLVVSKGDNNLLKLFGRKAWHFPQNAEGIWAGFYPANSLGAIAHLESLRARGATHLLIPDTSGWWLETYPGFHRHLDLRYRCLTRREGLVTVYSLVKPPVIDEEQPRHRVEELITAFRYFCRRDPAILDWSSGLDLATLFPQLTVFSPPGSDECLPYLDQSVDLVAVPAGLPMAVAEAHRVAEGAVLVVGGGSALADCPLLVSWRTGFLAANRLKTSIIIPVFNGLGLTKACLKGLDETLPSDFDVEIIVVDDASSDGTADWLAGAAARDPRLRIVRNTENAGFVASCNRAAQVAQGEILLFLNNDTVLLPGWFTPLLQTFREHPDAGAVGGRLLFPDGRIQEAGGMVFCDGSAAHFGRDDYHLDAEIYNVLREVDYCSAALLATTRKLFEEIGGFDPVYGFGYYEDTDYCFQVRKKGCKVYCQPQSTIVHLEGATAGTDLNRGPKHYQVVNQARFTARWRVELERLPARPAPSDRAAWEVLAFARGGRKTIGR